MSTPLTVNVVLKHFPATWYIYMFKCIAPSNNSNHFIISYRSLNTTMMSLKRRPYCPPMVSWVLTLIQERINW